MASQVQICNMALSRLGASTISALTDNTTEAKLCNTFFDTLADEVMAEGLWTSTIRRSSLARTTNTPLYDFSYEFQLPVDPKALKILDIDEDIPGSILYSIEDDKLLTDESSIKIRYIARLTDTEDWDVYLQRAYISRLASELAYPLTGDFRKAEAEFQRYIRFRDDGLALNGQQGSQHVILSNELIEVR